jgi:nitroreductase
MDVEKAIFARTTCHDYAPAEAPAGLLRDLITAAAQAPCHKLTWPWRFRALGPGAREAVFQVAVELAGRRAGGVAPAGAVEKLKGVLFNPMLVIAVSQVKSSDPERHREDYAAVACAVHNMLLLATDRDLGSKWSTAGFTRSPETLSLLGVPETEESVGFVFIGQPARESRIERPSPDNFLVRLP